VGQRKRQVGDRAGNAIAKTKKGKIKEGIMVNNQELLFEVLTPLGFRVRVTRAYWEIIITIKHPVMAGYEEDVKKTLADPDEIRQSKSDKNVYLFYKAEREKRWICAVSKQAGNEGFLITTYPTDAIKEGVQVWHR
jgi:hypothetical protein